MPALETPSVTPGWKAVDFRGQTGLSGDIEDVRVHGEDERVSVEAFYKGLDYHYRLVKTLSDDHG